MATQRGPDYIYLIKGIQTGGVCERKEIDEFVKDKKQLILFTLAFKVMSARPKDDVLSYYQLAGIHGSPFDITWPPVGGPVSNVNPGSPGYYCYHFGPLFLTWHRPYVLCVEQALHDIIMQLIDPDDPIYSLGSVTDPSELQEWKTAAETWRLPYWDFALRRPNNSTGGVDYCCLPDLALDPDNLWYAYDYPGGQSDLKDVYNGNGQVIIPLSIQTRTVRHAPPYDPANPASVRSWTQGISNIDSLKEDFQGQTIVWRPDLIDIMVNHSSYAGFTYGGSPSGNDTSGNLNAIHGNVHINTGGFRSGRPCGNMANVPAAGFDPIFFLWHCNIDRIGAMWQAANPNAWMGAGSDKTKLLPFRYGSGDSEFWTSERCRSLPPMGYTYPDLPLIHDNQTLRQRVGELYGDIVKADLDLSRSAGAPRVSENPALNIAEYLVIAKYETHEVGPFYIDITLKVGDGEEFITSIVNFVSPLEVGCANCDSARADHHTASTATLISPKLRELYKQGKLGDLVSSNTEAKLAANLKFTCYTLGGGRKLSSEEFKSLQIGVSRRDPEEPSPGDGSRAPRLPGGSFRSTPLRGITDGKPFGLKPGEDFKYLSTS